MSDTETKLPLRDRISRIIGLHLGYGEAHWDHEWARIDPEVRAKWYSTADDILNAVELHDATVQASCRLCDHDAAYKCPGREPV